MSTVHSSNVTWGRQQQTKFYESPNLKGARVMEFLSQRFVTEICITVFWRGIRRPCLQSLRKREGREQWETRVTGSMLLKPKTESSSHDPLFLTERDVKNGDRLVSTFINNSMFLLAYNSDDLSGSFCSKLLIHAQWAQACLTSDCPEDKVIWADSLVKQYHILEWAQALCIVHQDECNSGRDSISGVSYF